jgi:hypothetical protein
MYKWLFILDRFWSWGQDTNTKLFWKSVVWKFDILDSSLVVFRVLGKKIKIVTSSCGYTTLYIDLKENFLRIHFQKPHQIQITINYEYRKGHTVIVVLYWCLDLIRHNIVTKLKLNKYIFYISIPFCHHLYLSATLKQCFTEFAVCRITFHHVDMSVRGRIPTLSFKWVPILWRIRSRHQYKTILKKCCMKIWHSSLVVF